MTPNAIINGKPLDQISVFDRGLHYGDGVFETIAVSAGQALLWQQHLERLLGAAQQLNIPVKNPKILAQEVTSFIESTDHAVLKVILTRGTGGRGYAPPDEAEPNRICLLYEWPHYSEKLFTVGAKLRVCETRLSQQMSLAGMKHLNRLEQVVARTEWQDKEIFEGIMLDQQEHVIEGTMSNLFMIRDHQVLTAKLQQSGVAGVMREQVINTCKALEIDCLQTDITLDDLLAADACFITNSIIGVLTVQQIEDQHFSSHPITDKIQQHLLTKQAFVRS